MGRSLPNSVVCSDATAYRGIKTWQDIMARLTGQHQEPLTFQCVNNSPVIILSQSPWVWRSTNIADIPNHKYLCTVLNVCLYFSVCLFSTYLKSLWLQQGVGGSFSFQYFQQKPHTLCLQTYTHCVPPLSIQGTIPIPPWLAFYQNSFILL